MHGSHATDVARVPDFGSQCIAMAMQEGMHAAEAQGQLNCAGFECLDFVFLSRMIRTHDGCVCWVFGCCECLRDGEPVRFVRSRV